VFLSPTAPMFDLLICWQHTPLPASQQQPVAVASFLPPVLQHTQSHVPLAHLGHSLMAPGLALLVLVLLLLQPASESARTHAATSIRNAFMKRILQGLNREREGRV